MDNRVHTSSLASFQPKVHLLHHPGHGVASSSPSKSIHPMLQRLTKDKKPVFTHLCHRPLSRSLSWEWARSCKAGWSHVEWQELFCKGQWVAVKDKTIQWNNHCRENSEQQQPMAQKGNTKTKGNAPGQYRTACSNSSQMGEFTSDTWQLNSFKEAGAHN